MNSWDDLTIVDKDVALDDCIHNKLDRPLDRQGFRLNQRRRSLCQAFHLVNQLVVFGVEIDCWPSRASQHNGAFLRHLHHS